MKDTFRETPNKGTDTLDKRWTSSHKFVSLKFKKKTTNSCYSPKTFRLLIACGVSDH